MSSLDTLFKDAEKLYGKFEALGIWTKEKRITDYPCLGGDEVTPSYVFKQVSQKYIRFGETKTPEQILETLEIMKKLECEDSILVSFLMWCDYETENYLLSGVQYIKDVNWIASTSKNKEEFNLRSERLYDANTARKQALHNGYGLKNLKPLKVLDFHKGKGPS